MAVWGPKRPVIGINLFSRNTFCLEEMVKQLRRFPEKYIIKTGFVVICFGQARLNAACNANTVFRQAELILVFSEVIDHDFRPDKGEVHLRQPVWKFAVPVAIVLEGLRKPSAPHFEIPRSKGVSWYLLPSGRVSEKGQLGFDWSRWKFEVLQRLLFVSWRSDEIVRPGGCRGGDGHSGRMCEVQEVMPKSLGACVSLVEELGALHGCVRQSDLLYDGGSAKSWIPGILGLYCGVDDTPVLFT